MEPSARLKSLIQLHGKALHRFLDTMCAPLKAIDGEVKVNGSEMEAVGKYDGVGIISITGDCVGSVSLHIPKILAEKVTKRLLGLDIITNESDIYDAMGEMTNMIV